MKLKVPILDDDGIVMIASSRSLQNRYTNQAFDYDFPHALVEGMNAKELVCVGTDGGGLIEIVVEQNTGDQAEATMNALPRSGWVVFPSHQLKIDQEDDLLILPYSQYTYAAHMSNGEVEIVDGLSFRNPIREGLYDVFFAHLLEPKELDDDGEEIPDRSVWFILVPTNSRRAVEIDSVPGM